MHVAAALYYIYGPPLADINDIVEISQKPDEACQLHVAYLRRMAVRRKFRQRGIARQLLETAVSFCREHCYKRIELITTDIHAAAMKLYKKYGFRCRSYQPRYYLGGLVTVWTYEYEYLL